MKNTVKVDFNTIGAAVKVMSEGTINARSFDSYDPASQVIGQRAEKFTETSNFDEALKMLNTGWSEGSKQLTSSLKIANLKMGNVEKAKMINDIVGFQVHVPNYIQGIPTSMINKRNIKQKQRTITLVKAITYHAQIKAKEILEDSVKFLQIVQEIERQGVRVNVFTVFHAVQSSEEIIIRVKIKSASERLNISKMSFPLLHPSFLRRIVFRIMEINHDLKLTGWQNGYGAPGKADQTMQHLKDNEILIPVLITEDEATSIIQRSIKKK